MNDSKHIQRAERLSPEIIACITAFCCLGLAPGLTWFDAGELMAASTELGISHPPGMPVFSMMHKAVSFLLPVGDIAFRGNLASALLGALAVAFACKTALRLGASVIPAVLGAVATVISPLFLLHATAVEVYSGLALLTLWALDLILAGHQSADRRHWVAAALILGLGIGGHHAEVRLFSLCLVLPILVRHREIRLWMAMGIAGVLGTMVIVYLPIRSGLAPWRNWGDPSNFSNLWDLFWGTRIRAAYGDQMGGIDWSTISQFSEQIAIQTPVLFALGILGLVFIARRPFAWLPLVILLTDCLYSVFINPMGVRDQQNGLVTIVLLGIGLSLSLTWLLDRYGQRASLFWGILLAACIGLLTSIQHFPVQDDRGLDELLATADDKIPTEALTMVASDHFASGWAYRQVVEGARPDMAVIVRQHVAYPSSTMPTFRRLPHALNGWQPGLGLDSLKQLKRSWPVAWEWAQGLDSQHRPRTLSPTFPIFQNTQGSSDEFTSELKTWSRRLPEGDQGTAMDHATANLSTDIGSYLLTKKMFTPALEHLRWAAEISPQVHSRWTNLGVGLSAIGQLQTAIEVTKHALVLKGNDRTALINLARYYIGLRDWKNALIILDDLLAIRADASLLGLRGVVMANQANYVEAKQMFTRALAIDPTQPEARAGLFQLEKMDLSTP